MIKEKSKLLDRKSLKLLDNSTDKVLSLALHRELIRLEIISKCIRPELTRAQLKEAIKDEAFSGVSKSFSYSYQTNT